jgi:hypothetical protein
MFKNQYKKYMIFKDYFAFKQQMKQTQKLSYFIKMKLITILFVYRIKIALF